MKNPVNKLITGMLIGLFLIIPTLSTLNITNIIKNHEYYIQSINQKIKLKNGLYNNQNVKISLIKHSYLKSENNLAEHEKIALIFLYESKKQKIYELTGLIYNKEREIDRQLNNVILTTEECYIESLKIYEENTGSIPFNSYTVISVELYQNKQTIVKKYFIRGLKIVDYSEDNLPVVKKPAIYLYPPFKSKIEIELKINGKLIKTDPIYNNKWEVEADQNGSILFNSQKFNYLFYENTLNVTPPQSSNYYIISKENIEILKKLMLSKGLNENESNDFYNYLKEEINKLENNYKFYKISILDRKFLDQNMQVSIKPKPDNFIRVILLVEGFNDSKVIPDFEEKLNKIPSTLEYIIRDPKKFVAVEWGTIILPLKR